MISILFISRYRKDELTSRTGKYKSIYELDDRIKAYQERVRKTQEKQLTGEREASDPNSREL